MKFSLFIATIFLSLAAWALPEDFVVKTESGLCGNSLLTKFGSGIRLRIEKHNYVLTSDHTIYHGTKEQGICHRSFDSRGKAVDLELVAVHLGKGLALLQIPDPTGGEYLSLSDFATSDELSTATGTLESLGFPASSRSLARGHGRIFVMKSERHAVPLAPYLVEVDIRTEYGMSGGALVDRNQNRLLGLISHQYLKEEVGQSASLEELNSRSSNSSSVMLSLAIPSWWISQWIQKVLSADPQEQLRLDLADQLRGRESLVVNDLKFSFQDCESEHPMTNSLIRMDPDGAGIGGGLIFKGKKNCHLYVEKSSQKLNSNTVWPFANKEWFDGLKNRIRVAGQYMDIENLWFEKEQMRAPVVDSLSFFFARTEQGALPLAKIYDPFVKADQVNQKIQETSAKLHNLYRGILWSQLPDLSSNLSVFYFRSQMDLLFQLLETETTGYELVHDGKLKELYESEAWSLLFSDQHLDVLQLAELRSQIALVRDQLNLIRINP